MLHGLNSWVNEAAIARLVLMLNHMIGAEPVALQRLRPHAGRTMQFHFDGWPELLPALPLLSFRVTPAGLLEWCEPGEAGEPALRIHVAAANPALALAQALAGQRPRIDIAGDAAFAADLQWLIDNLRWDVEDDLARVVGPAPARQIARVGGVVARGLREAVQTLTTLGSAAARSAAPKSPRS